MSTPQPRYVLNVRAVLILAAVSLCGVLGCVLWKRQQESRILREALVQVRKFREAGDSDLAMRHLNQYLVSRPNDVDALKIKAELRTKEARTPDQILEAIGVYEQLLRLQPDGPASLETRRRLVELYVGISDAQRMSAVYEIMPESASQGLRYHAAEVVARQLLARLGPRGERDAEAQRLLAMALEGLAVPGKESVLDEAILRYNTVLKLNPRDAIAAERLARLYQDRMKDAARAERVLDDLLKAGDTPEVRLVRYRYFAHLGGDERASAEVAAAARQAPEDIQVLLAAAEDALSRGKTQEAHEHLQKIPPRLRNDLRILMLQGLIDFGNEHPEEAIEDWRRGLVSVAGTHAELTWRLAFVMLEMGRAAEAQPLVAQFRRLEGNDSPLLRFLEGIQDEHAGQLTRARERLEWARDRLDGRWQKLVNMVLGRCYETLKDRSNALAAYRKASQLDPRAVPPRLAVARLLMERRPDEAVVELEQGLKLSPHDPGLLLALAGILLKLEGSRPPEHRSWAAFDQVLTRAAAVAPPASVASLQADRLMLEGGPEKAVRFLEKTAAETSLNASLAIPMADILVRSGRAAEGLKVLDRVSAPPTARDQAPLRIARARALIALGRGREARAQLVANVDQLPRADQHQIWMVLGQFDASQGDLSGARKAYQEWARLQPESLQPKLALLELALASGNEAEVHATIEALRTLVTSDNLIWRLVQSWVLLTQSNRPESSARDRQAMLVEAERLVVSVLEEAPRLPAAHFLQGQVLERQGRFDEAVTDYRQAWELGIDSALPHLIDLTVRLRRFDDLARLQRPGSNFQLDYLSARTFLRLGDKAQAGRIVEQASQDRPEALAWKAEMLERLGRLEEAEATLNTLAEQNPGVLDSWLKLLQLQARHHRSEALAKTVRRIKDQVKIDQPGLLEARCYWAAGDRTNADQAFARALERDVNSREVNLIAARYFDETGRPDQAVACLKRVLDRNPNDRIALRHLALIRSAGGKDPAAWEQAWAAIGAEDSGAQEPEDRLTRAVVLARCPDPARRARAIDLLEALVADLPPNHPTAAASRNVLTRLLLENGRTERASEVAAVSAASGSDPDALVLSAEAYLRSHKLDAAGEQLDRLAILNPGDPREAILRVRLVREQSKPQEAAAALEKTYLDRENAPGAEPLGREAFRLLSEMGPDAAPVAERLGRRLALHNPEFSWMPALIMIRQRRFDEVIDLCRTAAKECPAEDLLGVSRILMDAALATGSDPKFMADAAPILDQIAHRAPDRLDCMLILALFRHFQGRYEEEIRLYRKALARDPENREVMNNLAWALSEGLHHPEEALPYANKVVELSGRKATYLDTRGVILLRLGRFKDAIADLTEAVQSAPSGSYYYHLARAYQKAGMDSEFRTALEKVRKSGLTAQTVDLFERSDFESLMKL